MREEGALKQQVDAEVGTQQMDIVHTEIGTALLASVSLKVKLIPERYICFSWK